MLYNVTVGMALYNMTAPPAARRHQAQFGSSDSAAH